MRILFISFHYNERFTYQENLLPLECRKKGHDTLIVTSDIVQSKTNGYEYVDCKYGNKKQGVVRLKPAFKDRPSIAHRLRKLNKLYETLYDYRPDVIFVNTIQTLDLYKIKKYKKKHTEVKIYFNTHTDYYTSGTNWISLNILHKLFFKHIVKSNLESAEKVFYISVNCGRFAHEIYGIPKDKLELLSLGGTVSDQVRLDQDRQKIVNELKISEDTMIWVQAGKMDGKKNVLEALRAFKHVKEKNIVYLLIGELCDDISEDILKLVEKDSRIRYLGWKSGEQLICYLNACNLYIQPGKVSAIAQTALCSSCAVILKKLEDYEMFVKENGWLIEDTSQLEEILSYAGTHQEEIVKMQKNSREISKKYLDNSNLIHKFC